MNTNNDLKIIDFSNGIVSTEIQHNFDVIQNEINNERLAVGGTGISYGFDFIITDFNLKITEGMLIANDGSQVCIDEKNIAVERPILIERKETLLSADEFNRIELSENPYSLNRNTTADNCDISESGVKVVLSSNNNREVSIANIKGNIITLNNFSGIQDEKFDVIYNVSYKRRDVVFIDKNYKLQYRQGITSTSPSVPSVNKDEYSYMLGYLEIDAHTVRNDNKEYASVKFIKDFRSVRNVYNDSNNRLYLCGIPFDSLKTIHITEPKDPEEYCLWYDSFSNELKVWRHTDIAVFTDIIAFTSSDPNHPQKFETNVKYKCGQKQLKVYLNNEELALDVDFEEGSDLTELEKKNTASWSKEFRIIRKLKKNDIITYRITRYDGYAEWVAANDKSYIPVQERFIWTPEYQNYLSAECEFDKQYFFFDSVSNRDMLFTPGKNCLEIMIDQIPLHSDQYEELTINDAIASDKANYIRRKITEFYHYNNDFEAYKAAENYENIGIGFKLSQPLDKSTCYIEARVTHRVNSNPIAQRFQRSATFVYEDSFIFNKYIKTEKSGVIENEQTFKCAVPFRYKENQLEVFVNGLKLIKDKEYEELASETDDRGSTLYKFKILKELKDKDSVSYKINSTIYSYDNVQSLLSTYQKQLDAINTKCENSAFLVNEMKNDVDNYTKDIRSHIETLSNVESYLDSKYLPKDAKIGKNNLLENIFGGIAKNVINKTFQITENNQKFDITDICCDTDFVLLFNLNDRSILVRDTDYTIGYENDYVFLYITSESVNISNTLYMTGIRFNK